jgi:hypothetical protein
MKGEDDKGKFSEKQRDFLNCFAVHRYHEVVCNMTEQDLEILHNPGWDKILEEKKKNWEGLYIDLMSYHQKEALKSSTILSDYSLLVAHNIAEFTCNEKVHIGSDLMDWICRAFIPFGDPREHFDWDRYFSQEILEILKDI